MFESVETAVAWLAVLEDSLSTAPIGASVDGSLEILQAKLGRVEFRSLRRQKHPRGRGRPCQFLGSLTWVQRRGWEGLQAFRDEYPEWSRPLRAEAETREGFFRIETEFTGVDAKKSTGVGET